MPHGLEDPVVLHNPLHCNRSGCLGLECLRWGDPVDNVRDRKKSVVYKRARRGGLSSREASHSERLPP